MFGHTGTERKENQKKKAMEGIHAKKVVRWYKRFFQPYVFFFGAVTRIEHLFKAKASAFTNCSTALTNSRSKIFFLQLFYA